MFMNAKHEAWNAFLYWLLYQEVPQDLNELQLVRCWALGEWLIVYDFMNNAMLRLIELYERREFSIEAVKTAFCETTGQVVDGSKIRMLTAEEAVKDAIKCKKDKFQRYAELGLDKCSKGHPGGRCGMAYIPGALEDAEKRTCKTPYLMDSRFVSGGEGEAAAWISKMEGMKWRLLETLLSKRVRSAVQEALAKKQTVDSSTPGSSH